jgi:hypothetical protein
MQQTTADLLEEFSSPFGYTQSDEITLFYPALPSPTSGNTEQTSVLAPATGTPNGSSNNNAANNNGRAANDNKQATNIYNGKIQKIVTLVASYCSVRYVARTDSACVA